MNIESLKRASDLLSIALDILDESEATVTASLVTSAIDALDFEKFERERRTQRARMPRRLPLPSLRSCA
ncbi:hypothetical protein EDF56_11059 [Novosphingobium sp. PhB165]|uniref:hypothetical protein n=1 Tax=Novosphingobium sp. PhB165 TaxID=2485105 RepID=UPI0010489230|nr:hypothetical protein [Novosphingobium sp. PhB165]TCM15379.1 hypothetical protein EDF56_11059 [Novosphingobium sp. PhB165]